MPYAKVNDINLYYEVHGEREPLVLNSGGGGRVESQELRIAALSPEYQVIVYEVRGAGRTDSPDIPYTMEMFGNDLAGLLDSLDITSAHVFGESFGSVIAMVFAHQYSERVRSLILASSSPGGTHNVYSQETLDDIPKLTMMSPEERVDMQIRRFMTQKFIKDNPEYVEKQKKTMLEAAIDSAQSTARILQAVRAYNSYDRLPEINVPTLIVHGEADATLLVENGRIVASRIPNAELVTFPDTGHMLLEAGDELYRVMKDFLKRNSQK